MLITLVCEKEDVLIYMKDNCHIKHNLFLKKSNWHSCISKKKKYIESLHLGLLRRRTERRALWRKRVVMMKLD